MPSRLSEYRPDQLRVKAKPRRTRRFAALTRSFNPGRISHYPGMSMEKQKAKTRPSRFHCRGPHRQIQKPSGEGRARTPKPRITTIRSLGLESISRGYSSFFVLSSRDSCSRRLRFPTVEDRQEVGCFAVVFTGIAVVEHKAQTHNGCFSLVSRLFLAIYLGAHMYL